MMAKDNCLGRRANNCDLPPVGMLFALVLLLQGSQTFKAVDNASIYPLPTAIAFPLDISAGSLLPVNRIALRVELQNFRRLRE